MTPYSFTNPVYAAADHSLINVNVVLTQGTDAMPYTAGKNDPISGVFYAAIVAAGGIAPYVLPTPAPVYVPASLIRKRLQNAGLWTAAATALATNPADLIWFTTLEQGVLPTDANAIALLTAIGATPSVILAPP